MTYRVTDTSGPLVTLTTNGAVYIIPAGPSVELAPSLVVSITVAPGVDTSGVDVEAIKAAYRGHVEVGDRATHDPTQDWSTEAARFAMEPLLSLGIVQIQDLAKKKVHSEGHVTYEGEVVEVGANEARLHVCNDDRGINWLDDATGISVKPGAGDRLWQDIIVARDEAGRWLVRSVKTETDAAC